VPLPCRNFGQDRQAGVLQQPKGLYGDGDEIGGAAAGQIRVAQHGWTSDQKAPLPLSRPVGGARRSDATIAFDLHSIELLRVELHGTPLWRAPCWTKIFYTV